MLLELPRRAERQPGEALKIGSNGIHELVWIASCDFAGRLAVSDQLPEHREEELALPVHQFTQIIRGALGTFYLIQNLIYFRAFAPEDHQFGKQQSEALPWRPQPFKHTLQASRIGLQDLLDQRVKECFLIGKVVIGQPMTDRSLCGNFSHGRIHAFARKDLAGSSQDFLALCFPSALICCLCPWHFLIQFLIERFNQSITLLLMSCQGVEAAYQPKGYGAFVKLPRSFLAPALSTGVEREQRVRQRYP